MRNERSGMRRGPRPARITVALTLLLAVWLLSLADLFFTIWAHFFTPFREMNPIADALLGHGLLPSLVIYKLPVTLLGTAIFWRVRHHSKARFALWGIVIVYVLLAVRWGDYTQRASAEMSAGPQAIAVAQS